MAKSSVPVAPRLPAALSQVGDLVLDSDGRWEASSIAADFAGQAASDLDVVGCRLSGSTFIGAEIVRARVSDTVFEQCDLSATMLPEAVLTRVEFDDCRLSGADLSRARLHDVRFHECQLVDLNLRMASGDRVRFERCDLAGADLYAAELPGVCIFDSNLTAAELSKASLTGSRLHGSTVDTLKGAAALRGVTINSTQIVPVALQLLTVFAIDVDDEREPPSR
jgi:uncharacterized protein YjbI with pentapeptide repeats